MATPQDEAKKFLWAPSTTTSDFKRDYLGDSPGYLLNQPNMWPLDSHGARENRAL
jgi:hypothetical protein